MHAAEMGLAGAIHAASALPSAMAWVQPAASAQTNAHSAAGWSWAKAIGVETKEPAASQPAKTQPAVSPQASLPTAIQTDSQSKATQSPVAAITATPTAAASSSSSSETPAKESTETVAQPIVGNVGKPSLIAAQKLAVAANRKTIATVSGKVGDAVETGKHKAEPAAVEAVQPAVSAPAPTVNVALYAAVPVPAQVTAAPPAGKTEPEDRGKEKTSAVSAVSAKRASALPAKADGSAAKAEAADAKSAVAADAVQASAPALEAKEKTVEAVAVTPQPVAHVVPNEAAAAIAPSVDMAGAVSPAPLSSASSHLAVEPKSMAAAPGAAEINSAHTISSGPGQLEVGVLDGTHGWLSIRTEMGHNGAVNALVTSGATAHDALRETIPAMAGYLAAEQLNVDRIAVGSAPEGSFAGSGLADSGQGSKSQQERPDGGTAAPAQSNGDGGSQAGPAGAEGISAALFGGAGTVFRGEGIGSWLSVTA